MIELEDIDDPISRAAFLEAVRDVWTRNFAALSTRTPREFAEQVMKMPDTHGAVRPFTFAYAPYQLAWLEEIFNPRNIETVLQVFSRGGKSRVVLTALGYIILERPMRCGVMWPVEGDGKLWSKHDFTGELVEPTPEIASVICDRTGQRRSGHTILNIPFPGGLLQIVGSNAPGRLRRIKARFLYGDEIDAIQGQVNDEGDILKIFAKRGDEFPDTIQVYCSYPSVRNRSRIEAKLLASDLRQWLVTCPKCGGQPMALSRTGENPFNDQLPRTKLLYEPDRPHEARLECPHCQAQLDDDQRYAMMMGGDLAHPSYDLWTPTRTYAGRAGFHAGSLLWPHPVDRDKFPGGFLEMLARKEIDAEASENPERARRVIINTEDALTYEAPCDVKPESSALLLRREEYSPSEKLPAGVLWIAILGDVQGASLDPSGKALVKTRPGEGGRIEVEIVGYGLNDQTWGLGYFILNGSPLAKPTEGVWAALDRMITTTTFPHPSGKLLGISGGLIDCGFRPDNVIAFTKPRARLGIFASYGSTQLARPIVQARPKTRGKEKGKAWEIGTNEAKDVIYQRLQLDNKTAAGYMHYPATGAYNEAYFKGLTAEDSTMERAGDGKFYRKFHCEEGVRNEPLDLRALSLAILKIRKPNLKRLAEELALPSDGADPAAPPAAPSSSSSKPAQPTKRPFITRAAGRGNFATNWRR